MAPLPLVDTPHAHWCHYSFSCPPELHVTLVAVFGISVWIVGWIGTLGGFAVSFAMLPIAWKITRSMGAVLVTPHLGQVSHSRLGQGGGHQDGRCAYQAHERGFPGRHLPLTALLACLS